MLATVLACAAVCAAASPAAAIDVRYDGVRLIIAGDAAVNTVHVDRGSFNEVSPGPDTRPHLFISHNGGAVPVHASAVGVCVAGATNTQCSNVNSGANLVQWVEFNGAEENDMLTVDTGGCFLATLSCPGVELPIVANGGPGKDTLNGALGNDTLKGNETQDVLFGHAGNDQLEGNGDCNPCLVQGEVVETLNGGAGNDTLTAGTPGGLDSGARVEGLNGDGDNDTLIADAHANGSRLEGGEGADNLNGGIGNDTLNGGNGVDNLLGGNGNDALDGGLGQDTTMDGGLDNDTVKYDTGTRAAGVALTLEDAGAFDDGGAEDEFDGSRERLIGIEHAIGSPNNDTIVGTAGSNTLSGLAGDDVLTGGDGDDVVSGGDGDDTLRGGAGSDDLFGGNDDDTLVGGAADDLLDGGIGIDAADYSERDAAVEVTLDAGVENDGGTQDQNGVTPSIRDDVVGTENVIGGNGSDVLTGSPEANVLDGGPGADQLNGGDENDTLLGGSGADVLNGQGGVDTVSYAGRSEGVTVTSGNAAPDDGSALDGANPAARDNVSAEAVIGSDFDDDLTGDGDGNRLEGGGGADRLAGDDGADTLLGGGGDDPQLQGGAGTDTVSGGDGADTADYADHPSGVVVTLDGAGNDGTGAENDVLQADVENARGGPGADTLTGNDQPNALTGGDGGDTLDGLAGVDAYQAGAGDDTVRARDGVAEPTVDCGDGTDGGDADADDTLTSCEGINPPVIVTDRDGDGIAEAQDCDDNNPNRKPGATEINDNGIDEDCDGADSKSPPPDRDGDGFDATLDCNDADARIRPGAVEIAGNAVDENCDGVRSPFPLSSVGVQTTFAKLPTKAKIVRMDLIRVPANAKVTVTCKSSSRRACAFRSNKPKARATIKLAKLFKGRFLPVGTQFTVTVVVPNAIGKVFRYDVKRNRGAVARKPACVLPNGLLRRGARAAHKTNYGASPGSF